MWDYGSISHCADVLQRHPFQEDLEREELEIYDEDDSKRDMMDATEFPSETQDCHLPAPRTAAKYNFQTTVKSWTDFLKVQLHARNSHELHVCHHGVTPFATYFDGLEIRGRIDEEAILDDTRRQLELCDQLDAVHTIFDMHDGFGGVTDLVLRWMHDEQPKCGKLVMALRPDVQENHQELFRTPLLDGGAPTVAAQDSETCAWVSAAFSFVGLLNSGVDMWTPMAVPLWSAKAPRMLPNLCRTSAYETSAVIATALETASLPYRLRGSMRPSEFMAAMAPSHRPVCGLQLALPLPAPPPPLAFSETGATNSHTEGLAGLAQSFVDLTAIPILPRNPFTSIALRGAGPRRLLELCGELLPQARRLSFSHPALLPLPLPFPQVFAPDVSSRGVVTQLAGSPVRPNNADVEACPTATRFHAAAQAGRCVALTRMVSTLKAKRRSAWSSAIQDRYSVEADDFKEVLEAVVEHLECGAADSEDDADFSDGDF